jgi:ATP-dependent protease HslVU (ClpYQ) peptidase subunit
MTTEVPDWLRDYILKSGEAIQHLPTLMQQSDDRWRDIAKNMNDLFAAHRADTDKLIMAMTAQNETMKLHMAHTDACVEEAKDFRADVWEKTWNILKWVIVVSVGSLVVLAGGSAIFKFFGA